MIERHIVNDEGDGSRLVIGPPPEGVEGSVVSLRVLGAGGEELARWAIGPESAKAIVEEIRERAGAGRRFL